MLRTVLTALRTVLVKDPASDRAQHLALNFVLEKSILNASLISANIHLHFHSTIDGQAARIYHYEHGRFLVKVRRGKEGDIAHNPSL
jgi:hypothetical protein